MRSLPAWRRLRPARAGRARHEGPPTVNHRSRLAAALHAATPLLGLATALLVLLAAAPASADRVVLLRVTGEGTVEQRDLIEDQVAAAVRALAHDAVTEAGALQADTEEVPETANEMRAVAELQNARWVVVPIVHDMGERGYWLRLRVGYAPETRSEELDAEVRRSREEPRLVELLQAMLRPEGLSEDGLALAGEDLEAREAERLAADEDAAREAEEAAERERREAEEAAERERREAEEAAERERTEAEREAAEREAWESRDRYGVADGLSMVQVGLGVRPLAFTDDERGDGGVLGTLELRYGRGFEGVPGLELRAGVELVFGAANAVGVHVGAAYLASPFTTPIHLGATVEVGVLGVVTGNRSASFSARASALVAWNFAGSWYLEASLPELQYLTASGGALALGASVRLGTRF